MYKCICKILHSHHIHFKFFARLSAKNSVLLSSSIFIVVITRNAIKAAGVFKRVSFICQTTTTQTHLLSPKVKSNDIRLLIGKSSGSDTLTQSIVYNSKRANNKKKKRKKIETNTKSKINVACCVVIVRKCEIIGFS